MGAMASLIRGKARVTKIYSCAPFSLLNILYVLSIKLGFSNLHILVITMKACKLPHLLPLSIPLEDDQEHLDIILQHYSARNKQEKCLEKLIVYITYDRKLNL